MLARSKTTWKRRAFYELCICLVVTAVFSMYVLAERGFLEVTYLTRPPGIHCDTILHHNGDQVN